MYLYALKAQIDKVTLVVGALADGVEIEYQHVPAGQPEFRVRGRSVILKNQRGVAGEHLAVGKGLLNAGRPLVQHDPVEDELPQAGFLSLLRGYLCRPASAAEAGDRHDQSAERVREAVSPERCVLSAEGIGLATEMIPA